jgi:hypothetical protein
VLTALAGFMGGLFVVSRMLRWLATLMPSLGGTNEARASRQLLPASASLLLHSGPSSFAIAIAAVWYVAQFSSRAYLLAVIAGIGLAVALVAVGSVLAVLRRRNAQSEPALTPERFLARRRRFFWTNSLLFATVGAITGLVPGWLTHGGSAGFAVLAFMVGFPTGWLWSWFMWHWYGAALQVQEKRRKERDSGRAV